ncbi:MAG: response regulator, partial [Lachnospiraceae bacterium]|nr:response regulator [Lachnospiraceae bacterium]
DEQEQILYANKALLRIFRCDTFEEFQELTGNSFQGVVHPDDLESVHKSIWEQIANSQYDLDYVEYRIIQKGGTIRWVEDYGHFIHSETEGDIFYVFVGDATEKRQRLLAEQEEKERQLQNQIEEYSQELKLIHQEHLRRLEVIEGLSVNYDSILYTNLDADRILPYRISDRIEHQFTSCYQCLSYWKFIMEYVSTWVYPEDRALFAEATSPSYIREKLYHDHSYYVNYRILKGNEQRCLQLRIADVSKDEHVSRIVMGTRTVDDEIQYEMKQKKLLEDALHHAKLANIAKNTFLSNMSHDIRTPLNAITGYTALAKNHLDDLDKVRNYLEKIESSNTQLLHLVNNVLEISRLESGNIQIAALECNLTCLTQELLSFVSSEAKAKGIKISVNLSQVTHHQVITDPSKLKQILLCLLNNAIKYTEKNGEILLSVQEKPELSNHNICYSFMVEDNGIGISEDFQKVIFEPFERVKNTTHSGVLGAGLGLSIAKSLTEMMGGTITLDSTLGQGSIFTVSLNLHLPSASLQSLADDPEAMAAFMNGRKILLVEDNEINREIEMELLKDLGLLVDSAEDGSVAIDIISHAKPDEYALIFMDIQMPVVDGYEATRTIRNLKEPALANIPIIALSANSFEEDRQRSKESGMNAHLAKPVNIPELLGLLTTILTPKPTTSALNALSDTE